jgi:hypothetical protein
VLLACQVYLGPHGAQDRLGWGCGRRQAHRQLRRLLTTLCFSARTVAAAVVATFNCTCVMSMASFGSATMTGAV